MNVINQPSITVSIVNASVAVENTVQRVLFVGQKVAAGSATAGALVENIASDNSENALFGENSMLATMVRAGKKENQVTIMDAIPLDDAGGGVDATGTITIVGTATADGTFTVAVGSELNNTFSIAVLGTDTATIIAAAIAAAITGDARAPGR